MHSKDISNWFKNLCFSTCKQGYCHKSDVTPFIQTSVTNFDISAHQLLYYSSNYWNIIQHGTELWFIQMFAAGGSFLTSLKMASATVDLSFVFIKVFG